MDAGGGLLQCANCGHENPENNKFCGECGQLLNDPHEVGRFSVLQARATDPDALSASVEGVVDPDRAPFPQPESVPKEYLDQWRPIDSERPLPPRPTQPVFNEPVHVAADRSAERTVHHGSSVLGLSDPEPQAAKPRSNGFLSLEPEHHEHTPLHGPSFLGLGDAEPEYTYEEEPRSHARAWFALVILIVIGVLAAMQWRAIADGLRYSKEGILKITLPLRNRQQQNAPPATEQASADEAQPASTDTPKMEVEPPPPQTNAAANNQSENPPAKAEPQKEASAASSSPASETPAGGTAATANTKSGDDSSSDDDEEQTAAAQPTNTKSENPAKAAKPAETAKTTKPVETASAKPPRAAAPKRAAEPEDAEAPATQDTGVAELRSALAASDPGVQSTLLWKAVAKGNVDAQVRLADMYANGIGVAQNCDQALVLMRSAAAKPNVRARVKMGSMYASGKCVGQDRLMAYKWMSRALELDPGSDWVRTNRQSVWGQMSTDERLRAGRQ